MTNCIGFGIFEVLPTPSWPKTFCTLGSSGSADPSWNASGFLSSSRCLMPVDTSPASYNPAFSLARGSFASEPVIPGGSEGAGCGANGLSSSSSGSCAGGGVSGFWAWACGGVAGVCASIRLTPQQRIRAAPNTHRARLGTRFIVSPLRFFLQHRLHNHDLRPLPAVHIRREVEQLGILPRARGVEQVLHHGQRATVVLNHSG